jgi:signal transduction histidine kinase
VRPRALHALHGGVRLRLTLLFGALFLAAGVALIAYMYGVLRHSTDVATAPRAGYFILSGGNAIAAGPQLPAAQQVSASLGAQATVVRDTEQQSLLLYSGIALGLTLIASVALGWFAAGRALRPLRRITTAARRISATNLQERLAIEGPDDDLRELADTIDGLFGRLETSFEAQRQFVANASHELRTPLARSRTMLEVALRDPGTTMGSLRATCERVLAAGQQQERLIEALLTLARSQRGIATSRPVDLAAVAHDVLAARGAEIAARGLAMDVTLEPAPMAGDKPLAERAVANLIDNALRYNVADGAMTVQVETADGTAVVRVENTGPVVDDDDVPRLLEPFQRLDGARVAGSDGLGLGLSIVQAIATAHGAGVRVEPRDGGGLITELRFPALSGYAPPAFGLAMAR